MVCKFRLLKQIYTSFSGLWVGLDLSFLPPSFPLKSRRALRPFDQHGHLQRAQSICKTAIPECVKKSLVSYNHNQAYMVITLVFLQSVLLAMC